MTDGVKVTRSNTAKLKSDASAADPSPPTLHSIDAKLNSILTVLEKTNSDITYIKNEQKDMKQSLDFCHNDIRDIKESIAVQDSKILKCENEILQNKEELRKTERELRRIDENVRDLEQYSHRNNLIIYGVPEDKNENVLHVMQRLAKALQFENWSTGVIDAVHRMGKTSKSQPRPIIIRFVSRLDKDLFLSKRKVKRNLKATDLGFSSENSIYVNESLTPANRELLKTTRDVARDKGYSFVWTTNCTIFTRRERGTPAIKIASAKDLDRM